MEKNMEDDMEFVVYGDLCFHVFFFSVCRH